MGQPSRRKKMHKGDKPIKERYRTKRKTKDLDQIHDDMKTEKLLDQKVDYDVTGNAQHYCLHCAKYFISVKALKDHIKSKPHKKRLKRLETEPYTQAEAERAAGMGSYIKPKVTKVVSQTIKEDVEKADTSGIASDLSDIDPKVTEVEPPPINEEMEEDDT